MDSPRDFPPQSRNSETTLHPNHHKCANFQLTWEYWSISMDQIGATSVLDYSPWTPVPFAARHVKTSLVSVHGN